MHPRALARLMVIAALLAACNSTPSPAPTGASASNAPAPTDATSAGPGATGGPAPSQSAADSGAPTSMAKIGDALAKGAIDEPTAILYRLYATVGDDRLPEAYRGTPVEDHSVRIAVRLGWDSFTAEQQAAVLPFMVRPTSTRSYWAPPASALGQGVQLASVKTASAQTPSACQDGFVRKQVSPTIPILVWGQCGGMPETTVAALVDEVRLDMSELWGPMTQYMGEPIGDANLAGDTFADSPEGGDGLLDIYLVDSSVSLHGRVLSLGVTSAAETSVWPPYVGPAGAEASSSFIVVNTPSVSGVQLRTTLAHEFFHSLEYSHNAIGMTYLVGETGQQQRLWFWFVEACAVWAQDEFVPEGRATEGYARFQTNFRLTAWPLSSVNGNNEYASFVWPLFMQQELGRSAVADAWKRFERKQGYWEQTHVLDGMLSFKTRFRDFAVRVWNERLNPGNPIDPVFQDLDKDFPKDHPSGLRASLGNTLAGGGDLIFSASILPLWSKYWVIEPAADVKAVNFDFSPLFPQESLDVDLILNIKGNWVRRSGNLAADETICDVSYAIVVISNHEYDPNKATVDGGWTAAGETNPCNAKGSWSVTLTGPRPGAGSYTGTGQMLCSATSYGGSGLKWTATGIMLSSEISQISLQENDTFDSLIVQTPGGLEGGQWYFDSHTPNMTTDVTGSGDLNGAQVSGHATWTDMEGNHFSADVDVDCSEVYLPG